jgi:CRISPR-associated protein Csm5
VQDEPYLPGSSLKGALRTILFRQAFRQDGGILRPQDLARSRSWAAQGLEHELLSTSERRGDAPNTSLLRTIQVADSAPIASDTLAVAKARVFGQRKTGPPINLECIRADAVLHSTLTIDNYLFDDPQASAKLNFGARRQWVESLAALANEQAQQRIRQEIAFYKARGVNAAGTFYRQLAAALPNLSPGQFVVQVGWGGGWDSKTLSYLLPDATRDAVVGQYQLARNYFKAGETPFPRTRRALAVGQGEQIEPARPFGWLLVEMHMRSRP